MSYIINPTKEFVNSEPVPKPLAQKSPASVNRLDVRVIFMGTPEFAVPVLKELIANDYKPVAVVTAPDKPAGREQEITMPPVKIVAQENRIPVLQPETKNDLIEQVLPLKPDLIALAAYGRILPKEILAIPKYGSVNVHPSLLPKYRGPAPVQFAILNGDFQTGVTIMLMNEKMDEGDVLATAEMEIGVTETTGILETRLADLGADLLVRTLKAIDSITPIPQDHGAATYAPKLKKDDGLIGWEGNGAEVDRHIRAMTPWPTAFTFLRTERLIILEGRLQEKSGEPGGQRQGCIPGTILEAGKTGIRILCGQGPDYRITRLQPEGRKSMDAAAYIAGGKITAGDILGRPPA